MNLGLNYVVCLIISSSNPTEACWHRPSPGENLSEVILPVEVKESLEEAIHQLGTYAMCQRAAYPSRQHTLALCYQHKSQCFTFAVFHAGGVTLSPSFKPFECQDDIIHIARFILAILSWTTVESAGLPSEIMQINLDTPSGIIPVDRKEDAIHCVTGIKGRMSSVYKINISHPISTPVGIKQWISKRSWVATDLEAYLLKAGDGEYGLPVHFQSSTYRHEQGKPLTNHLFLDPDHVEYHYFPSGAKEQQDYKNYSTTLFNRMYQQHILQYAGLPITHVKTFSSLEKNILDSMIGGDLC